MAERSVSRPASAQLSRGKHRKDASNFRVLVWLGAGAITVGVGTAMASAAGVAAADTGTDSSASSASSDSAGPPHSSTSETRPSTKRERNAERADEEHDEHSERTDRSDAESADVAADEDASRTNQRSNRVSYELEADPELAAALKKEEITESTSEVESPNHTVVTVGDSVDQVPASTMAAAIMSTSHVKAARSATAAPSAASSVTTAAATTPYTDIVSKVIPIQSWGARLTPSPDGKFLYVSNKSSIDVIDVATNTKIRTIPVTNTASSLAVSRDGTTLYLVRTPSVPSEGVSVIDISSGIQLKIIPLGASAGEPHLVTSPTNDRLYAYSWARRDDGFRTGTITVIDSKLNTVINSFDAGEQGWAYQNIAISPDGKRLFLKGVTQGLGSVVRVVDTASQTIEAEVPIGARWTSEPMLVSPDGRKLYFGTVDYTITSGQKLQVIDTVTLQRMTVAVAPDSVRSVSLGMSPDGRFVYQIRNVDVDPSDLSRGVYTQIAVTDLQRRTVVSDSAAVVLDRYTIPATSSPSIVSTDGKSIYFHAASQPDLTGEYSAHIVVVDISKLDHGNTAVTTPTLTQVWNGFFAVIRSSVTSTLNFAINAATNFFGTIARVVGLYQSPTKTSALYDRLRQVTDADNPNSVWVDRIVSRGVTRYVVYLGGTIPSSVATNQATILNNVPAYSGFTKSNQIDIIKRAIAAGNNPNAEVMLVGYSQGGLDAQNIARTGQFNVKTVITFGSPIIYGPPDSSDTYKILHIQADGDPIPGIGYIPLPGIDRSTEIYDNIQAGNVYRVRTSNFRDYADRWWLASSVWGAALHGDVVTYKAAGADFDRYTWPIKSEIAKFKGVVNGSWNR